MWECGSPAWWWCYLRCSALANGWPLGPPLVGWVFSLSPSGSVLVVAGAILGWHGQESGAKFVRSLHISLSPFPQIILLPSWCQIILQPPQIILTFPQIILLQTSSSTARLRYATLGSPPPLGRPSTERPLCVGISPQSLPSPVYYYLGELVAASLGGQRLRSVPPCMVIFSLSIKG